MIFQQLEQARWTAFVYFMHSATASWYHHSKVRASTPSLAPQWSIVMKTIMQNLKKQDTTVEPAKATYASGWDLFPRCVHWWCAAFIKLWMCTWWSLFQHRARNACCLLARLLMIWISCPCVCAQFSLSSYLLARPNTHTQNSVSAACFLHSACSPLAQLASVDYGPLTAIMILHKQHLSAHLSLFPPSCPLLSIHLCSISASLPPGWKCTLPPQLKITPKSPLWYLRKSANVNRDKWCLSDLLTPIVFFVTRHDAST